MVRKNDNIPEKRANGQDELQDVLQTVQQLKSRLGREGDNVEPLNDLLLDKTMQALIKLHEKVRPVEQREISGPSCVNAAELVQNLSLMNDFNNPEVLDLISVFRLSPHLMALLHCHDQIASKNFEPELPEADLNESIFGDEEESMKVVRLIKGNEPLGATIAVDELTGNIVIARILKGGAADRSGLIRVNDILVEVNKVPARGKNPEELISLLADFHGPITFRLIPGESPLHEKEKKEPPVYVRAKFNYDPQHDHLIPCPQAGLRFYQNDVLRIVSKDDDSWWQAALVEEGVNARRSNRSKEDPHKKAQNATWGPSAAGSTRAGLVPSVKLQSRREHLRRQATIKNFNNNAVKGSSTSLTSRDHRDRRSAWSVIRQSFRRSNKGLYHSSPRPDHTKSRESVLSEREIVTYEDVVLMSSISEKPETNRAYRPVVLVGPQGVGRNELKDRLIDSNPTHFGVPVPHTSRPKLDDEEDGKDYHFVTREYMERGIRDNLFLEYGEYKGNLYGTSLNAVKTVIANHQVCVLMPYPQALKILNNGNLKPFIIYVKPPAAATLKASGNVVVKAELTIDRDMSVPFSNEELIDLVSRGEKMEASFGHLFDYTIINDSIERAFTELKEVAFAIENEPQWVPKTWLS